MISGFFLWPIGLRTDIFPGEIASFVLWQIDYFLEIALWCNTMLSFWCLVPAVYKYLDDHPEIVERPAALMRLTSRLRDVPVPYSPDMEVKSDLQIPMGRKCHRLELNPELVVAAWDGRQKSSIRM